MPVSYEMVWVEVDVATTAAYELWKDDPWYDSVHWAEASQVALALVQLGSSDPPASIPRGLGRALEFAVGSLLDWPIDADERDVIDGGHRLAAMKKQGVGKTLGRRPRPT